MCFYFDAKGFKVVFARFGAHLILLQKTSQNQVETDK